MKISDGIFHVNGDSKIKLDGDYEIECIKNEEAEKIENITEKMNVLNQIVYLVGNVLVRKSQEDIADLIQTFIKYTYDPCEDLNLDVSSDDEQINEIKQNFPEGKVLFTYKNKVFLAFNRYVFFNTVFIYREGTECSYKDKDVDFDDLKYKTAEENKVSSDEVVLCAPNHKDHKNMDDYTYAFMIIDKNTEVVEAFGLYS